MGYAKPTNTWGTQKWNGTKPSFKSIATTSNHSKLSEFIIDSRYSNPLITWIRKYFIADSFPVEFVVETIRGINVKIIISIPTQTPNQELTLRVKIVLDKNKVPMASFHNVERINLIWGMNPIA
jgi:hypothetical protein